MSNKFLFRVDAGGAIGLGHFFRSLSLAYELQNKGAIVHFSHTKSTFWESVDIPFEHLEISGEDSFLDAIRRGNYQVLYVDGLIEFSSHFYPEAKKYLKVVFYQNITNSKRNCDVFFLPGLHYDKNFFSDFDPTTEIYKGLEYVILNDKVLDLAQCKKQGSKKMKPFSIGITTGGSDPRGVLLSIFKAIDFAYFKDISFTFLVGKDFQFKENLPAKYPDNVCFRNYEAECLITADIVIATFGVTTYELLYLGKPILSIGHAPSNAEASNKIEEKTGSIINLGLIDKLDKVVLNKSIKNLVENKSERDLLSQRGAQLIDGQGVTRVGAVLTQLTEK